MKNIINKTSEGISFIQNKAGSTAAVVAVTLPLELVGFSIYSAVTKSWAPLITSILNNAKLVGLSVGIELLDEQFQISQKIEEKLGENAGKFTKFGINLTSDLLINLSAYGCSKLGAAKAPAEAPAEAPAKALAEALAKAPAEAPAEAPAVNNNISYGKLAIVHSVLDFAKLSVAEALDQGYITFPELDAATEVSEDL